MDENHNVTRKKMRVDSDILANPEQPLFVDKAREILAWFRGKRFEELQAIGRLVTKPTYAKMARGESLFLRESMDPCETNEERV